VKSSQRLAPDSSAADNRFGALFAGLFGAFLGLSLAKFGNPPIFEKWVTAPTNGFELVLDCPWPITWAYWLLGATVILGFAVAKRPAVPWWLLLLPACWLTWQAISGSFSVDPQLSWPTVAHFGACTACFYLGVFCLPPAGRIRWIWPGLFCGLLVVIAVGWEQHFGGLEQTRRYFFTYLYPRLKQVPPEYIKKLSSPRIFSTLFYPNALAGGLLLLLPPCLQVIWQQHRRFTPGARFLLIALIGGSGLACLLWSGSKGGWLLMLLLGLLWMLRLPFSPVLKRCLVIAILLVGLAGFFLRYAGFFEKGATSVSARFDYWQAAIKTTLQHPFTGSGPGTFSIAYQRVKRPESEMSRLVHNDYLEQASDSGVPGFLLYSAFIIASVILTFPQSARSSGTIPGPGPNPRVAADESKASPVPLPLRFAIWLGVLGWALQSFVEFGLYIPGLVWPALAFLGFLVGEQFSRPTAK